MINTTFEQENTIVNNIIARKLNLRNSNTDATRHSAGSDTDWVQFP